MNKINCEICGTAYPDTSECCPICGCSREYTEEHARTYPTKMPEYIPEGRKKGGAFSASHKKKPLELYDYDEDDFDSPQQAKEPGETGHSGTSIFLVVVLTVLIAVSLLAAAYLFFRYELPAKEAGNQLPETSEYVEQTQTETETTEAPTVPCESIVLTAAAPTLTKQGQYWLLHTIVKPEDTTDVLTYESADETVVTVTAEGRLCAVGDGQTEVTISCGSKQIVCPISVAIETEQTKPAETVPETTAAPEKKENPDETTQPQSNKSVELKLKQSDITFTKKGVTFQLELDCDLKPEDVTWMTMNSNVVICHDGLITVLGTGTTKVIAQYGDQQAVCIVRCRLK